MPIVKNWLVRRSLRHYWRTNLAVVAGVATATAVLSGALLVGHSVRESLRDVLFERLGATGIAVTADRFFREELAEALAAAPSSSPQIPLVSCPILHLRGVVTHEVSGRKAYEVNVYGVDDRFWRFHGAGAELGPQGRVALIGGPLARRLGVRPGDPLLVRVETAAGIPRESLFGRRETPGRTIRLESGAILEADRLGEFSLRPSAGEVLSIFVPLRRLQRDLGQPSRANVILLNRPAGEDDLRQVRQALRERFTLEDVGVRLRALPAQGSVAIESSRMLLDEPVARAAFEAAAEAGATASGVYSYLANAIRASGREIPYSVITAADLGQGAFGAITVESVPAGAAAPVGREDAIWLNEWAWRDLGVKPGEAVEVDYYVWQDNGSLVTRTARFRLAGVVPTGGRLDATLVPDVPGITDAASLGTWDPPFPLDLGRVRPRDEDYWSRHHATPKAFIGLSRGQDLWGNRYGRLTAVRLVQTGVSEDIAEGLRRRLDPERCGFAVTAVRQHGLEASRGAVDLGAYFLAFGSFLVMAALLLSALFFRLGVEQRAREIGTLEAVGFPVSHLRRLLLAEGVVLALGGILVGAVGAVAYGGFLVTGLRTWWAGAVGVPRLALHVSWGDLALGAVASVASALGASLWTLRGLRRNSPRALLGGVLESGGIRTRRVRALAIVSAVSLAAAAFVLVASALGSIPDAPGFAGGGTLLLVALLSLVALYLRREHAATISGLGWPAFMRLAARNAAHRPARSLLAVALIASATFIIVSVEAFRKPPEQESAGRASGTGGYALVARAALPVVHDPNGEDGREALGISPSESPTLAAVSLVPFRERQGEDASCLNPYAPQEPTILGAPRSFLADGRFRFQASLASTADEKRNPWLLLDTAPDGGVIPAIGDANTIQYVLHLSVGDEIAVRGRDGEPVHLRIVAALRDSILQGELVVSESNFLRVFPEVEGYRFFLVDAPPGASDSLAPLLTERLADWGVSVESAGVRLARYHQVENTYLSTFQSLGGLGLVLGTVGLAAILLRNVLERRRELALLRAVGYRQPTLAVIIVAEHLSLMASGLACGIASAAVAIVPAAHARGGAFPVAGTFLLLVTVLAVGVAASVAAAAMALRAPLLDALGSE